MDEAQAWQLVERAFAEVIDGNDHSHLHELFDPDFVDHGALGETRGHEAFIGMLDGFRAALPDYRHELSDLTMIDGSLVFWQVHVEGTFSCEMMGARGEGQPIDLWVANAARIRDGKILEHWGLGTDSAALMLAQMGLQPGPAGGVVEDAA